MPVKIDPPPPEYSIQPGVATTLLYNGSRFQGHQKSKGNCYDVEVILQYVDMENSYLCGYLKIKELTDEYPTLTTFFDGEIISKRYPFLTRKWDADEEVDKKHWFDPASPDKINERPLQSNSHSAFLGNTSLVPGIGITASGSTSYTSQEKYSETAIRSSEETPPRGKNDFDGLSLIRKNIGQAGIPQTAQSIVFSSWWKGTIKQYKVYLDKWVNFATQQNFDTMCTSVKNVIEFLTHLFQSGLHYSAINTARSALSQFVKLSDSDLSVGEHSLIWRFLRGIFVKRPALARYKHIWDVNILLTFLKNLSPATCLSLKQLTIKTVILCMLVTGQRCQTIAFMDIGFMLRGKSPYTFSINQLIKQSAPGKVQPTLIFKAFPADRRLCIVTYLDAYIKRTQLFHKDKGFFLSFCKPFTPVSKDTIARWIRTGMLQAGIDTLCSNHTVYMQHLLVEHCTENVTLKPLWKLQDGPAPQHLQKIFPSQCRIRKVLLSLCSHHNHHYRKGKFLSFYQFAKTFNTDEFNYETELKNTDFVFMRWKEHFLVPDHTIKVIDGASFAGFYYICFQKSTSTIEGYYYHRSSECGRADWFQSLNLTHVPEHSVPIYQFR